MSKIRSLEDLIDRLSDNARSRKRELISIRQTLPPATPGPTTFSVRVAPVMAYAHWEGFVKDAATVYLAYLSKKSVPLSRLKPNLQALACRSELITAAGATKRIQPHLSVVARLVDRAGEAVTVPHDVIDTESNLTWDVFSNICLAVGIDTDGFWSEHRGLIDDMFRARCEVSHGQLFAPKSEDAAQYVDFVLAALNVFTTDIENAAATNSHLRPPAA